MAAGTDQLPGLERCWPSDGRVEVHRLVEGNTRTSGEYRGVSIDGSEYVIPAGSSTDWKCQDCPIVFTFDTGINPTDPTCNPP